MLGLGYKIMFDYINLLTGWLAAAAAICYAAGFLTGVMLCLLFVWMSDRS